MKTLGYILGCAGLLILLPILGLLFGVISLPFHTASNLVQTTHDITDKTINADNTIYNYEWFKQQYEDIQAMDKKIVIARDSLDSYEKALPPERSLWTFEDKNEDSRLRAVYQGLRTSVEDMIATYNARSKMANRSIFKDGLIPDYLEIGKNILTSL